MTYNNINELFAEYAQYKRMADETAAIMDNLKIQIIGIMEAQSTDTLIGNEHKATYKEYNNTRIDTKELEKQYKEITDQFRKTSSYKKFLFA